LPEEAGIGAVPLQRAKAASRLKARLHAGTTGGVNIDCPVAFEGSFHSSTIHKTVGALIAFMTRSTVVSGDCTGGTAIFN
jgi:hypothetical protein